MAKWCFNYDSGEYEYIDRNGFSFSSGEFFFNCDNSEYQNEENDDNPSWRPLHGNGASQLMGQEYDRKSANALHYYEHGIAQQCREEHCAG